MIASNGKIWRIGAALGAVLILSACENPWSEHLPSFDQVLSAGWLEDDAPPAVTPIYCYETIGSNDCYQQPVDGAGNRLRGFEGPPPPMNDDR